MITTERLILRPFEEEDIPAIVKAINFKEIANQTRIPFPYTAEDAKDFLARQAKEQADKSSFAYGIFKKSDDQIIGGCGIHHIHWGDGRGEFGYWLTPAEHKNGYAREACYALLRYLFYDLQLNRVEIEVKPDNKPSQKLALWLGAEKEGMLRKRCCSDRCNHDVYLYGLLREDFERKDENKEYF